MAKPSESTNGPASAFRAIGLAKTVDAVGEEIRELYLADSTPWVVGYSGGKDSSAVLQLVWMAIRKLPAGDRTKPIHVISTDTLVEQPVVARVGRDVARPDAHRGLRAGDADPAAQAHAGGGRLVLGQPHRPRISSPAPEVSLVHRASQDQAVQQVHPWRRAEIRRGHPRAWHPQGREPAARASIWRNMRSARSATGSRPTSACPTRLSIRRSKTGITTTSGCTSCRSKTPGVTTTSRFWACIRAQTEGGECPLVVDTSTPSCGSSRFGCWVCTVVDKDRSMEAMIKNDEEKIWMTPLLELRNELDQPDRDKRDFRRMNGQVQLFHDRTVPGPYKKEAREYWLRRVLEAQGSARQNGPAEFREIQLISLEELDEIRRIWLHEKHEFDDSLPRIYQEVTGRPFPKPREDGCALESEDWAMLREICSGDEVLFDASVALLAVEQNFRGMTRRVGVTDALEKCLKAAIFETEEDAVGVLTERTERLRKLRDEDENYPSGQLALFPEEPTDEVRSRRADANDSGADHASEFLPLPRRADVRPDTAACAPKCRNSTDRSLRRQQRHRQDDAAGRGSARALRTAGTLFEAGRPWL